MEKKELESELRVRLEKVQTKYMDFYRNERIYEGNPELYNSTKEYATRKPIEDTINFIQQELDKAREEQFTKEELKLILDGLETRHNEYSGVIDLTKNDEVADKVSNLLKE